MELKTKKYIKNTGSLPGFAEGYNPQQMQNIHNVANFAQTNWRPGSTNTNGYSLGGNGLGYANTSNMRANFAGAQTTVPQSGISNFTKQPTTLAGGKNQSQADSSAAAIHPGFAIGAWLGGGVLEGLNRIKTSDQLINEAGTSEDTIAGITYQKQNEVDAGHIMSEYNKQSAADWLTNPARALTGIFGRNRAKREAELAQRMSMNTADAQRGVAYTTALRLNNAKEYGDQSAQYLYGAANGKMPLYSEGTPNALVSNQETLGVLDKYTGDIVDMTRVPGKKNNNDTNKVRLPETDRYTSFVLSNKYGLSDQGTYDPIGALERQRMLQDAGILGKERKIKAKNGRLPKYIDGSEWGNIAVTGIGALAGLDQILQRDKPRIQNSYASNPYELNALTTLAGLRTNMYPITRQLINAEGRTNNIINTSGGMSTAQRDLGRRSSLLGLYKSIADAYAGAQMQDNQYLSDFAKSAINVGESRAQRRMNSTWRDEDYNAKSHAAWIQRPQMGEYNMMNALQSGLKNANDYYQFKDTMSMYRADQKQRNREIEAMRQWNERLSNINNYSAMLTEDDWKRIGKQKGWRVS